MLSDCSPPILSTGCCREGDSGGRNGGPQLSDNELPNMPLNWYPLWLSLRVAGIATAISLAAGIYLAYVLANRPFRGRDLLDAAVTLPLTLPPTVLGYYLLVAIGQRSPIGQAYEWLFHSR